MSIVRNDRRHARTGRVLLRVAAAMTAGALVAATAVEAAAVTGSATQPARDSADAPEVEKIDPLPGRKARPATPPRDREPNVTPPTVEWPQAAEAAVEKARLEGAGNRLLQAGNLPVWVGDRTPDGAGSLSVRMLAREKSEALGVSGPAVQLTRLAQPAAGAKVRVRFDIGDFAGAVGGDWATRLRLVQLPGCAVETPDEPACQEAAPLASALDLGKGTLTADVALEAQGTVDASGTGELASGGPGRPGNQIAAPAAALPFLVDSGGSTVVAVTATPSGPSGDWTATSLSSSASWQAGGSSGSFNWGYSMRVPGVAGGLVPSVDLQYSSGQVDGRVSSANNQPSWVGEGFSFSPGFVERTYQSCARDMDGGNNTVKTGDLCWDGEPLSISFGEWAGELIPVDDPSTTRDSFRLRNDDGTRIERVGQKAGAGEHFKLTTPDGTQYFFGKGRATSGAAATDSAWKVPVYGNHSGEECYQAGDFAASHCSQTWRWNLDYVLDPHGNSMTYFWQPETNSYGRNLNKAVSSYDRGGYLKRVEYGTRAGTEDTVTAPARILFGVEERCVPSAGDNITCAPGELNDTTAKHWPDVPYDQICTSTSSCADRYSPTFFTRKRLSTVTTQVATSSGGWNQADRWTLTHTLPDPGDGTNAALWLDSIQQDGEGSITPRAITFQGDDYPNRVDGVDNAEALRKFRITGITDEYSQHLVVRYTDIDCTPADKPANPDKNTRRCFPAYYTPPGATAPDDAPHWFHKYLVTEVSQQDLTQDANDNVPAVVTRYDYRGGAAWAKDDDPRIPAKYRTWRQWRGYEVVATTVGETGNGTQQHEETRYYRGMNGDPDGSGGNKTVSVTDSTGTATPDHWRLAGQPREVRTFNGPGGAQLESTITDYTTPLSTTAPGTRKPRIALVAATHTRTPATGGSTHAVDVAYTHDSYGMVRTTDDHARIIATNETSTTTDRLCTTTTYAQNTAAWMLDRPATEKTVKVGCGITDPAADKTVSASRYYYDGRALGAAPGAGNITKVEELDGDTGSTAQYATTAQASYDNYGRQTSHTDALGAVTTTSYQDASPGGAAKTVTVTSPDPDGAGSLEPHVTTTTYDTRWASPTRVVDPDGKVTNATYDLGMLTKVWKPGRSTSDTPNLQHSYTYADPDTGVANTVTTETLMPDGGTRTHVELFDGMLRSRQTQTETEASDGSSGRALTITDYDSRGLVNSVRERIYQAKQPSTTIEVVTADAPATTTYTYDGAGRTTSQTRAWSGEDDARTTTTYTGNQVAVTPPQGGTATTTITDPRGRTLELREYLGGTPSGEHVTTRYGYTPTGDLKSIVDEAGNQWSFTYDLRGRQISSIDPDAGSITRVYDDAGRVVSTTDAAGKTMAVTYDALGRRTTLRDGSPTGEKRAEWVYDTLAVGFPTSSTRYLQGVAAYTSAVTDYDNGHRPTGAKTTVAEVPGMIPAELAGTYETRAGYFPDGSPATTDLMNAGPLAPERLEHGYDAVGRPTSLVGSLGAYVLGAKWSVHSQLDQMTLGNTYGKLSWQSMFYQLGSGRLEMTQVDRQQKSQYDERAVYGYDPAGNLTSIQASTPDRLVDGQCFAYDGLRQLTEAWTPADGTCTTAERTQATLGGDSPYWHSWTYDNATGNRLTEARRTPTSSTASAYTYPAAGQSRPHAVSSITRTGDQTGTATFGYDERGNATSRPGQDLTWDIEGKLVSITDAATGEMIQEAAYDPDGRRFLRVTKSETTLYLADGTELTHESDTGQTTGRRYYSFAGRTIAVREGNNRADVTTLVDDHQGTGRYAINNTTGDLIVRRQTPFGGTRGEPAPWPGQRGFVGGTADPDAGLTHIGARPYDAEYGTFLAVDPILDPTDSRQINGYAYANNNPTTFSDPSGEILIGGTNGNTRQQHDDVMRHTRRHSTSRPIASTSHLTKIGLAPSTHSVESSAPSIRASAVAAAQKKTITYFSGDAQKSWLLHHKIEPQLQAFDADMARHYGGTVSLREKIRPGGKYLSGRSKIVPSTGTLARFGTGAGGATGFVGQAFADAGRGDLSAEQRGARLAVGTGIGVTSGVAGAVLGAQIGMAFGSIVPGAGTVAGMVIGAGIGWGLNVGVDALTERFDSVEGILGDWW